MTVYLRGMAETVRAFRRLETKLARELQDELKKTAEPVASAGRQKIGRYRGARVQSITPRAQGGSVFVTQKARKVTGLRGDFGGLQQRRLDEALQENEGKVIEGVERFLDHFTSSEGF